MKYPQVDNFKGLPDMPFSILTDLFTLFSGGILMTFTRLQRFYFSLCLSLSIMVSLCLLQRLVAGSAAQASSNSAAALESARAVYPAIINSMFSQQQKLIAADGGADNFFANSVAIDGDTIVVGASPVGAVYVFVRAGGGWSLQQKLKEAVVGFGISVSISGDTLVGAAAGEDSSTGAVYVFVRAGGVWSQQQRLIASDRVEGDNFGVSVGISSDTVVVGARFHQAGPHPQQGSAYVFARAGGMWSEQQHLTASDGGVAEFFGVGV
jgi:hypothetical protein